MPKRTIRPGLLPYLAVGLIWFAFLMVASRVRLIEPIFLWVMAQGLIVEKLLGQFGGVWISRFILLIGYMGAALIAWLIFERPGQRPAHQWRRAVIAWVGIQVMFSLVATALVHSGALYE
jgi:hypothetical protein